MSHGRFGICGTPRALALPMEIHFGIVSALTPSSFVARTRICLHLFILEQRECTTLGPGQRSACQSGSE